MQEPEVKSSIRQLRRSGGAAWVVGSAEVHPQPEGKVALYKSVTAKALLKLPVTRPKKIRVVLEATAEYECTFSAPLPEVGTATIRNANAAAYWLAMDNLKTKFIEEIRASRAGIQDKRVNNLVKVWITPLTREHLVEESQPR